MPCSRELGESVLESGNAWPLREHARREHLDDGGFLLGPDPWARYRDRKGRGGDRLLGRHTSFLSQLGQILQAEPAPPPEPAGSDRSASPAGGGGARATSTRPPPSAPARRGPPSLPMAPPDSHRGSPWRHWPGHQLLGSVSPARPRKRVGWLR